MQRSFQHMIRFVILVTTWTLMAWSVRAQEELKTYYFDGEEVVFVFDVRSYAKALLGENALKVDFADLGIHEIAVTGQFNDWSKKGWRMTRRDEFTFELHKRIQDFNDAFPLDFRYIINGRYIADPEGKVMDKKQFEDDFLEDIYKVDLSVIKITEEGNTTFYLKGHTTASEVILAGTFNGWNERAIKMNKSAEGWELRADLPAGRYEYKFIVDGEWMHDPANRETVKNEHHTLNSVLYVNTPVTFSLKGFPDAQKVILAGSFNDWNERKLEMTRVGDYWTVTIPLYGGKHTYKFIVDGKWMTDPANPIIEHDGYGHENSVRLVH